MNAHLRPLLSAATLIAVLTSRAALAETLNGFAAMGASESQGNDVTGTWVPQLQQLRGLNFGGVGYPFNVAIGGATSATLLDQQQPEQVATFVQTGDVDLSYLSIGGNDFSAVGGQIASGALSGAARTAWAQGVVDNIDTATDIVLAAHPVGMIVAGMPDVPSTPGAMVFSSPTKIARGEAAVNLVDSILKPDQLSRGLVFVDLAGSLRYLESAPLVVGGVTIDMVTPSTDPTHFFQDGKHPAAVGNGLVANQFLEALNLGYGTNYPLLTDQEILNAAGRGALYTGETSYVPYANFVSTPVPEPATWGLDLMALVSAVLARRARVA